MNEMMKQCCGENGKPDFEKMKQFMQGCGEMEFSDDQIDMMKEFCCKEGMPDMTKMRDLMKKCGCQPAKES